MAACRVLVADDHSMIIEGLSLNINQLPNFKVVGQATNGQQLYQFLADGCDVLVLDLSMPGTNGVETVHEILEQWPDVQIVVHSMVADSHAAKRVYQYGACSYVTKSRPAEELIKAIEAAAQGERYFPSGMRRPSDCLAGVQDVLTKREIQIVGYLCRGLRSKDIAIALELAESTVATHIAKIKSKLNATSIADIVRIGIELGIVQ